MDFIDWRKRPGETPTIDDEPPQDNPTRYHDFVDYMIQQAQKDGLFDNLEGTGKSFRQEILSPGGGKNAITYHIMKNSGYLPKELALRKEIQARHAQLEKRLAKLRHRLKYVQSRSSQTFEKAKRAFLDEAHTFEEEYAQGLKEIRSNILTLSIIAPASLQIAPIEIEPLLQQYRQTFYIWDDANATKL
jgi:Domain of unknown function (DUF1992)